MYGDGDVLRRRVDQLHEQALDIRSLADQLVNRTEALGWRGRAADSMRERVTVRSSHLREAAARHDTAAESLDRHVQEREAAVEAIADAERKARNQVADAANRVARARSLSDADPSLGVRPDPVDEALAGADLPPSGDREWLTFELPGPASTDQPTTTWKE